MSDRTPRASAWGPRAAAWAVVLAAAVAASALFTVAGLPSPELFGSLVGAMAYAVTGRGPEVALPRWGAVAGQALIGVSSGAMLNLATLRTLGGNLLPIAAVTIATLVLSLLAGQAFARLGHVDAATGTFSMIAGGASGITAIARELGADDRITSVVQYLRVVTILIGMPVVTATVFRPGRAVAPASSAQAGLPQSLAFVAVSCAIGIALAYLVRFPSGTLLGPLFVAGVLSMSGALGSVTVPGPLMALGYAFVGLQVGLRFTRSSLLRVGRLLPLALVATLAVIGGSAAIGLALSSAMGVPALDAYLATTPGGLYAVLATAAASGADVTFVLAVQVIRLILVLASAPLIAAWFRRHGTAWVPEED